jgi:hypothetical protein
MPDPYFGYKIRDKLFPGEDEYFKANPKTTGMAAFETGDIILNPYAGADVNRDAVAKNEALRLLMRNVGYAPTFDVSRDQSAWFSHNAPNYLEDPAALRETILARLYSGDNQFQFTTQQHGSLMNLLTMRPDR